jgi:hypothetical protein
MQSTGVKAFFKMIKDILRTSKILPKMEKDA